MGKRRQPQEQREDYGFFGPDSVTWRVWSYPTSLTIGFQRAVAIEELDPDLVASVDATQAIFARPRTRYDRTVRYFAMVAFGDTVATTKAADVLVKVHSAGVGIEPGSGRVYDANDPDSQLWIQLTGWHSVLYAYERFGPGKLSAEDEARFWEECAIASQLQTFDPDRVPRSREELRAYYAAKRPELVGSEVARKAMHHLLNAEVMLPEMRGPRKWVSRTVTAVLRRGTISTMPRWMREMAGISQSRLVDALVRPVLRIGFAVVHSSRRLQLALLHELSPMTVPVVRPVLMNEPPKRPITMTPYAAQDAYGYDRPARAHLELRTRQRARVLGEGVAPSQEGIVESEPILGATHDRAAASAS